MQVRSFVLSTGQELVAQLVESTETGYKIKNPLVVHMMRGPDGQPTLAFAQWSMVQNPDEAIDIFNHALVSKPVALIPEVEASYISNTSGILVPAAPSGRILQG